MTVEVAGVELVVQEQTYILQCVVRTTVLSLGEHTYTFKVIRVLFEGIGVTV